MCAIICTYSMQTKWKIHEDDRIKLCNMQIMLDVIEKIKLHAVCKQTMLHFTWKLVLSNRWINRLWQSHREATSDKQMEKINRWACYESSKATDARSLIDFRRETHGKEKTMTSCVRRLKARRGCVQEFYL